jgi:MYXO-CTERM domain-containing protein
VSRETGLVVGFNEGTGNWEDENGNDWSPAVRFSLPDYDVFEINANASTPSETRAFSGVGTILFNMIVNPANGNLYVTNTEANNRIRFEGLGDWVNDIGPKPSGDPPSVIGNLHKARVTVIDPIGNVTPRHLNKHIPYGVRPVPAGVKERSIGTPLQMAVSGDGSTLYVVGFGSNNIAVFDTAQLENDTFVPDAANMIAVPRPTGLVLDETRGFLWVSSRNFGYLYSVNLSNGVVRNAGSHYSPEPLHVKAGRKFLYDTQLTSSNGEASCSSCHVFGDMDDLAWDLGDPDASPFPNPNPEPPSNEFPLLQLLPGLQDFDPLKGPMTTQSLRGMKNAGPMHWRGDRTGGSTGGDPLDSNAAFLAFNVAFPGLIGRDEGQLDLQDMQDFTDFALALTYPPNPIRPLNNSLSSSASAGETLFTGTTITDQVASCRGCHHLDRSQGFFGTAGFSTFENETMEFKVAHLRNAYQKVGMFGQPPSDFFSSVNGTFMGDQVRGTGFLHDGSVATAFNFLSADVFNTLSDNQQRDLEAFIMEFDSDLAPIVGQQTTVTENTGAAMLARVDLLIQRADTTYFNNQALGDVKECDLIAKGVANDQQRGWLYIGGDTFQSDDVGEGNWSRSALLAAAAQPGQAVTFTCVPPGSGKRMGINRDNDGLLDFNDAGGCSASGFGASRPSDFAAFLFMIMVGLTLLRRRRRSRANAAMQEL